MKRLIPFIFAVLLMLPASVLAENISLDGVVVAGRTSEVYAESTAIVEQVYVSAGQTAEAGEAIAVLRTTKVYAEEDGVITAVFGETGDLADNLTTRYGAAVYMETDVVYTVAATTDRHGIRRMPSSFTWANQFNSGPIATKAEQAGDSLLRWMEAAIPFM